MFSVLKPQFFRRNPEGIYGVGRSIFYGNETLRNENIRFFRDELLVYTDPVRNYRTLSDPPDAHSLAVTTTSPIQTEKFELLDGIHGMYAGSIV